MAAFKNKNFKKRDYECQNVVACTAYTAPNENFVPCENKELHGLDFLYEQAGVRYYGFM